MSEVPAASPASAFPEADLPAVVQRYLDGESLRDLAAEHGKCWKTLYHWLLAYSGDQYQEIVTKALTYRIADADLDLETASDKISIARARERCRFTRMDYERRRPREYGQAPAAVSSVTIIVDRSCGTQPIDITGKAVNGSE